MIYSSAHEVKASLTDGDEIAFLDVREHGQYGEGHPFFAVPFPYSRLESLAEKLLPCRQTRIVLLDAADGVAERAASVLEGLGYRRISILDGGASAWKAAGYTLFKGVNVPSKTFGELLEHAADTPRLSAKELHDLLERDPDVIILDGRTPQEFKKMSIPGAISCPNAELGYRFDSLVRDTSTPVVVNCAGRTRSILGVEGLRLLPVGNPVYALENGTQGWRLAGYDLEHGAAAAELPAPAANQLESLSKRAVAIIDQHRLALVSADRLRAWMEEDTRTTFLLDVRTRLEYDAAHWPGARHAPGGQLVQATDQYVAVRNARVVLSDDIGLRAATTALRLRQMGHDVFILDADAREGVASTPADADDPADTIELLAAYAGTQATILDASPGMSYRKAHIDGAAWVTRARLDRLSLDRASPILVTGSDPVLIDGVVADLRSDGRRNVTGCSGSPEIWTAAGFDLVATPDKPSDDDCIDYLFFVHDRHDGNLDAARRYLEWETGLVDQLDEQERSVLKPE